MLLPHTPKQNTNYVAMFNIGYNEFEFVFVVKTQIMLQWTLSLLKMKTMLQCILSTC